MCIMTSGIAAAGSIISAVGWKLEDDDSYLTARVTAGNGSEQSMGSPTRMKPLMILL